ncbi:MAG: lamin tail domain-containing protein [Chitinophagaceae bacterium]
MKKILLLMGLFVAISAQAQKEVVLNEIVPDPSGNNEEYIELYNTTGNAINLDCYTLVAYDFSSTNGGVWTYNLPNITIQPFGFVVFASAKPIDYKCTTKDSATFHSWNDLQNSTAGLAYYPRVANGNTFGTPTVGQPTTNFIPVSGGNSAAMAIMLFKGDGTLVNGFFTNNSGVLPAEILSLSDLTGFPIPADAGSGCSATTSLQFNTIQAPQAEVLDVQQAVGANNNYHRLRDGICGEWVKGQTCNNPLEFTPGSKNSTAPPPSTSPDITTAALELGCGNTGGGFQSTWKVSVTITAVDLLPAKVYVYNDNDKNGALTGPDAPAVFVGDYLVTDLGNTVFYNVNLNKGSAAIVQVITAAGCLEIVSVNPTSCSPLPVQFKSFTATRNQTSVLLKWETASEKNNSGFAVERNVNGSWEQIAWVPSQAANGNSDVLLAYTYMDYNNIKGITQYRIRQVDIDQKSMFSAIRSVRGEGQLGKTIVYPNPTNNGRVNIVFDDASMTREISVMDMSGRVVRQIRSITNNNITIENLNPGMYTIRIVGLETGEQAVHKVVVNKR